MSQLPQGQKNPMHFILSVTKSPTSLNNNKKNLKKKTEVQLYFPQTLLYRNILTADVEFPANWGLWGCKIVCVLILVTLTADGTAYTLARRITVLDNVHIYNIIYYNIYSVMLCANMKFSYCSNCLTFYCYL